MAIFSPAACLSRTQTALMIVLPRIGDDVMLLARPRRQSSAVVLWTPVPFVVSTRAGSIGDGVVDIILILLISADETMTRSHDKVQRYLHVGRYVKLNVRGPCFASARDADADESGEERQGCTTHRQAEYQSILPPDKSRSSTTQQRRANVPWTDSRWICCLSNLLTHPFSSDVRLGTNRTRTPVNMAMK